MGTLLGFIMGIDYNHKGKTKFGQQLSYWDEKMLRQLRGWWVLIRFAALAASASIAILFFPHGVAYEAGEKLTRISTIVYFCLGAIIARIILFLL